MQTAEINNRSYLKINPRAAVTGYDGDYPFGLIMNGRSYLSGSPAKEGFTGKERDETGIDYFGARYYRSDAPGFISVDLLVSEFPNISPYAYGNNNPLKYTDPTGMAPYNPIFDEETGEFLGTDDLGLAGEAIFMKESDFEQGMAHASALKKGRLASMFDFSGFSQSQLGSLAETSSQIGFSLANDLSFYRNGMDYNPQWASGRIESAPYLEFILGGWIGSGVKVGFSWLASLRSGSSLNPFQLYPTHGITLSKNQYSLLRKSINSTGIKQPIKYVAHGGKNYVVDGHHRLRISKELGFKKVPVEKVNLPHKGYNTVDDLIYIRN